MRDASDVDGARHGALAEAINRALTVVRGD